MEQTEILVMFVLLCLFYYAFANNPRVNQKFAELFRRIQRLVDPSSLPPEEKQEKKEDCKDKGTEKDKNKVFKWNDRTKKCTRSCAPGYEKSSKPRGYCVKANDSCAQTLGDKPDLRRVSAIWDDGGICTVNCQPGYWEAGKVCVQEHAPCKGKKKPLSECLGKHPGRVQAREINASRWSTYQSAQDAATELSLDKGTIETTCNNGGGQVGNYEVEYKDYIRFNKTEDGTCGSITDQDKCEKTTDELARYCKFQNDVCVVDPTKTQTCSNYRWETMCVSPTVHAIKDVLLTDGTCTDQVKTRTTTCNRIPPPCKANYVGDDGEEEAVACCGHSGPLTPADICPADLPFCRNSKCSEI